MIAYCSVTGNIATQAAIFAAGWRWLFAPNNIRKVEGRYAPDNGAWSAYKQGTQFDAQAFKKLLSSHAERADWIVLPDIVAGGRASLELTESWLTKLSKGYSHKLLLIAVQDGIEPRHIEPLLAFPNVGLFLGGETEYKLERGRDWGAFAYNNGLYFHVGRVNTARRILWCNSIDADSFDGTSVAKYASTLPELTRAMNKRSLFRKKV